MKNTVHKGTALGALILCGALAASAAALADAGARTYEVTIQVATRGQPIAPSVFVTHDSIFSLFDVGPAINMDSVQYEGLARMAETGGPGALATAIGGAAGVDSVEVLLAPTHPAPPVLLPGDSNSTTITASGNTKFFSAVGMLAATNDAFYGVRGVALPISGSITVHAVAYDAGSEPNNEIFADTPAGSDDAFDSPDEAGEGHIHVHAGIDGIGTMAPEDLDWRNPVVEITITRIKGDDD